MRGLGYFPSDYEIECMLHELSVRGRRKISFEELVKLYINHSRTSSSRNSLEKALMQTLGDKSSYPSTPINITKSHLISILTESGEKIDMKDADRYLKEIFQTDKGNNVEEFSIEDFLQIFSRHVNVTTPKIF
jgi:Ca2+-binding EF-hand superfamily protein